MKALSAREIQKLDHWAIETLGIPSLILMENAGRLAADEISKLIKDKKKDLVTIICGMGNNGGDGMVIARHLDLQGWKVRTFLIGKSKNLKPDARTNYQILKKLNISIDEVSRPEAILRDLKRSRIVVDALLGVGLNRNVVEPFKSFIEAMNGYAKSVVAVDVPSGLDATSGKVLGVAVRADLTVTFSFPKKGFYKHDGPGLAGKIKVLDIGIPHEHH